MIYQLATVGLAPLLIYQGKKVRRETPRLPEPLGARCGKTGTGEPLRLLIAGDSAAAGVGVEAQDQALAGRLCRQLAERYRLSWKLVAQTGYTAADVVTRLQAEPEQRFDVALLSVGVNDVTGRTSIKAWNQHLWGLSDLLRQRFSVETILFTSVPPMHLFPALPQPLRWYLGYRADMLDQSMRNLFRDQPDIKVIESFSEPNPSFIAADGFHPGAAGYEEWATAVFGALSAETR
ncbi:SGNH/GDSL hydrolase family protein [Hahella ganghwensis]|uniref:SGNH/GDSL hydrolase family protein n=1 Tax=Hahella ganghwensis TaxID=286420 RepID=UPI00036EBAEE|nr:SGNH/GDSL hydrolase family protein [Hahella ganghwensis]